MNLALSKHNDQIDQIVNLFKHYKDGNSFAYEKYILQKEKHVKLSKNDTINIRIS